MSAPITINDIVQRLTDFPHDRYLYIGGFMRSVAWAAGTLVLIQILRKPTRYFARILPWLVSLLATMVTLTTWGRGVLLTNSRANVWDSLLPTLMGIVEFCLFAILAPRPYFGGEEEEPTKDYAWDWLVAKYPYLNNVQIKSFRKNFRAWHLWFFVLAIHTLLAVFLTRNRLANMGVLVDCEPRLCCLAAKLKGWIENDRFGATMATTFSTLSGILMVLFLQKYKSAEGKGKRTIFLWALLYVLLFVFPIYKLSSVISDAENQRQETDNIVFRLKNNPTEPICREELPCKNLPAKPPTP